jgi:hypothetical protein
MNTNSNQEPADDLADRAFTAIGGSTGPESTDAAGDAPAPLTNAQILAGAIAAGREVFCAVTKLKSPKTHLDDDTAKRLGELWGPVLEKHGWNLGEVMGNYALEVAAIIGTLTIGASVRAAVIAEIASQRKADDTPTDDPDTINV